jgi:hypothetical protein
MPIAHFLTKAYLTMEKFDHQLVTQAFYLAMKEFDEKVISTAPPVQDSASEPGLQEEENQFTQDATRDSASEGENLLGDHGNKSDDSPKLPSAVSTFIHILQFCDLCFRKKVTSVLHSGGTATEMDCWFESIASTVLHLPPS